MEEQDRQKSVIDLLSNAMWEGAASELPELVTAGLVGPEYQIHPGVAEAGRDLAGPDFRSAVDRELAGVWTALFSHARQNEAQGMGAMLIRAGRSAVPYLMRLGRWNEASTLLEHVMFRDETPAALAETLPLMQRIAEENRGTPQGLEDAGIVGWVFWRLGRIGDAEQAFAKVERDALKEGLYRLASSSVGDLVSLLTGNGRFDRALEALERMKDYDFRAGLGRWTRLGTEARRLRILNQIGRFREVLAEVQKWRAEYKDWPEAGEQEEAVNPWNVREVLLGLGRTSASALKLWEDALSLNAERFELARSRGATELALARTEYDDYGPLLRLNRHREAQELLLRCLEVFKRDGNHQELGDVYSALADLEDKLQHPEQSIRHETAALRYRYAGTNPAVCAGSHFNLANYLFRANAGRRLALAHRLVSVLILYQTGNGKLASSIKALRLYARISPTEVSASFDEVCTLVEQIEGVRFRAFFSSLPRRAATGDDALQAVLTMARTDEETELLEPLRYLLEAAVSGQDTEPLLAALQDQLPAEAIEQLRAALAEARAQGQGTPPADPPNTD